MEIDRETLRKYVEENVGIWSINETTDIIDMLVEYEKDRQQLVKNTVDLGDVVGSYVHNNKARPQLPDEYEVIYSDGSKGVEYYDRHSWKVEIPVAYWKIK